MTVRLLVSLYTAMQTNGGLRPGIIPAVKSYSWPEFIADLGPHDFSQTEKLACPALSPAELLPNETRSDKAVKRIHFGVLDYDQKSPEALDKVLEELRGSGLGFAFHTTWSHLSPEKNGTCAARLHVPFSRPVESREWAVFWPRFNDILGTAGDTQCKDPSRLFFVPSAPKEREGDAYFEARDGAPLDVDALLADVTLGATAQATPSESKVLINDLTNLLKTVRQNKRSARWDFIKEKLPLLIAGESLAADGEQDTTLFKMARDLVELLPNADAESLAKHFAPSIQAMATGPVDDDWVLSKILRAQAEAQNTASQKQQLQQDTSARFIARALDGRDTPYTPEELQGFADLHGVNLKRLRDLWIVQKDTAYYTFLEGQYKGPWTGVEIEKATQVDLAPACTAGVELSRVNAKGELVPKDAKQLVRDYGSLATEIRVDLSAQVSRFDVATGTIIEAPCPLRPLDPVQSPYVAQWLELLGGKSQEKLLDWVALVTKLEVPCLSLYLDGKKGAGKTLFANGLSRLWTTASPTSLSDALSNWNSTITKCPLVFGDEFVPKDFKGNTRTAELREFIQARSRTLKRKYLSDATFLGCIRLILAANNMDLLTSAEQLTANDIEAIVDRVLHIEVSAAPAEYLASLSAEIRNTFVSGDAIAKHATYLRLTRTVESRSRFIIEGDKDALHRSLTVSSGLRSAVCNWLIAYLLEPQRFDGHGSLLVRRYQGRLLATSRGLAKFWTMYETNVNPPPAGLISKALAGLSTDERVQLLSGDDKTSTNYRVLDTENLISWAIENGYADRETVLAKIAGSTPRAPGSKIVEE